MLRLLNRAQFDAAKQAHRFLVVHFSAEWCAPCKQLNTIVEGWVKDGTYPKVTFADLDAEKNDELTESLGIETVPHIVFYRNGNLVQMVQGARLDEIKAMMQRTYFAADSEMPLNDRLKAIINRSKVLVFLTGTPEQPQCGFTGRLCEVLASTGVPFDYFDIMTDFEVLEGLKKYSQWPTYPQVYVNGELIGGCDIILEMHENGTLVQALQGN
eukprot:PhM_4_TR9388/c0_g2_i1/m.11325